MDFVPKTMPPDLLLSVISVMTGGPMKCLIINCHGIANEQKEGGFGLDIGQGIGLKETKYFAFIKGLFKCIVLPNCQVARVTNVGKEGDGRLLCSQIARASGAHVVAPIKRQRRPTDLPEFCMDKFEGLVQRFNPSGDLERSSLLGIKLIRDVAK
ncbi:MAG: hypothetical protein R2747_09825 [Pyrinomonadaceae bacterium]